MTIAEDPKAGVIAADVSKPGAGSRFLQSLKRAARSSVAIALLGPTRAVRELSPLPFARYFGYRTHSSRRRDAPFQGSHEPIPGHELITSSRDKPLPPLPYDGKPLPVLPNNRKDIKQVLAQKADQIIAAQSELMIRARQSLSAVPLGAKEFQLDALAHPMPILDMTSTAIKQRFAESERLIAREHAKLSERSNAHVADVDFSPLNSHTKVTEFAEPPTGQAGHPVQRKDSMLLTKEEQDIMEENMNTMPSLRGGDEHSGAAKFGKSTASGNDEAVHMREVISRTDVMTQRGNIAKQRGYNRPPAVRG